MIDFGPCIGYIMMVRHARKNPAGIVLAGLAVALLSGCAVLYSESPRFGIRRPRPAPASRPLRPQHPLDNRKGSLPWPVAGTVSTPFGALTNPKYGTRTLSSGIDIVSRQGAAVTAVDSGKVTFADRFMGYGKMIIIDHGGRYHSIYSRLADIATSVGSAVRRGQTIATAADTTHFEFRVGGKSEDPMLWLAPR